MALDDPGGKLAERVAPGPRNHDAVAGMPGDVLLICAECGCASDQYAAGWAAFSGEDPEGSERTSVAIMCPVCAFREFEWKPENAEGYV